MKIVHAADLHIDSPFRGLTRDPAKLPEQFQRATRRSCKNLVDLCLTENAELLLLAGDIFDGDCRDAETGEFFCAELDRLREAGCRVVLVYGNHDAECHVMRCLGMPGHVHCLSSDRPETVVFDDIGVAVHGQSYARTAIWDNLARDYPNALADHLNIGLLHTNAIGYLGDPLYAPCTVGELVDKGYDYWALGHIHWPQVLHEAPWVAYSGNLQARYMEEAGPKGCMLIDVAADGIRDVRHVPLDSVRWTQLRVPMTTGDVWYGCLAQVRREIERAWHAAGRRPLVARIVLEKAGAEYDSWFADFVNGTSYESRVRDIAGDTDWIWVENVILKGSTTPKSKVVRSICRA